jgi:hypothetical protein
MTKKFDFFHRIDESFVEILNDILLLLLLFIFSTLIAIASKPIEQKHIIFKLKYATIYLSRILNFGQK